MLDTIREVSTPELIELRLRCAGLVPRMLAWLIDLLIRIAILIVAQLVLAIVDLGLGVGVGRGLFLAFYFLVEWIYPVLFEVLGHGATPGKRLYGLQVVNQDGSPIGWGPSLTRNLLRTADFLPIMFGFGVISMLCDREFRRIGDIVAGSLVVYRREVTPAPNLPDVPVWRPAQALTRQAQRAVLDFAERAPQLSHERQKELAMWAPQLTGGQVDGDLAVKRLFGLARLLVGRNA